MRAGFLVKASVALTLLLTAACLAVSPLSEKASAKPLEMGIAHPGLPTDQLDLWFPRAADPVLGAGAGTFHIYVAWRQIAPASPTQDFVATNPADPEYRFTRLDREVRAASAAGMRPMMSVFRAPDFAEGAGRPVSATPGSWKPNPQDYADFATALADRYDGDFTPSGEDDPLPRVDLYEVWNEPNLGYLRPQISGNRLIGADRYRALANAFYEAIHDVNDDATVAAGATAPFGVYTGPNRLTNVPPLRFLRRVLCLKAVGRKGALRPTCNAKLKLDAFSHHPISSQRRGFTDPTLKPARPDDVSASNFGKLRTLLRAAIRLGRVELGEGIGSPQIWATEIWDHSNPPDPDCGVPLARQARNLQQTLYLAASQGADAIHYYMIKDNAGGVNCFWNSSGLYFADQDANPKPALTAFRFPFLTVRKGRALTSWGRAPSAGTVVIERFKGVWRRVASVEVAAGNTFTVRLGKLSGAGRYRATVGDQTSLVWKQSAGRW